MYITSVYTYQSNCFHNVTALDRCVSPRRRIIVERIARNASRPAAATIDRNIVVNAVELCDSARNYCGAFSLSFVTPKKCRPFAPSVSFTIQSVLLRLKINVRLTSVAGGPLFRRFLHLRAQAQALT